MLGWESIANCGVRRILDNLLPMDGTYGRVEERARLRDEVGDLINDVIGMVFSDMMHDRYGFAYLDEARVRYSARVREGRNKLNTAAAVAALNPAPEEARKAPEGAGTFSPPAGTAPTHLQPAGGGSFATAASPAAPDGATQGAAVAQMAEVA